MSSIPLYPLRFTPIFKEKIWGGDKIKTLLGKDFSPLPNCGESWEISGVKGDITIVSEGPLAGWSLQQLLETYQESLVGRRVYHENPAEFPLLIKFLDAREDLSIQVHPNDAQALANHGCKGKTEMWYVIDADPDASLISGFNREMDKQTYLNTLNEGKILDILNREVVTPGDVYYMPSGRVHTLGAGLLIAEIQQTSDITYRIYDFDRVDDKGNKRELHNELAADVIDYKQYPAYKTTYTDYINKAVQLVKEQYFETNKITFDQPVKRDHSQLDSFVIYICLAGACTVKTGDFTTELGLGDCLLIPAFFDTLELHPDNACQLLETYIPR